MFGKPKEVEEKKSSIFKDYVLPIGALLIRSGQFNESQSREAKQNWNHARDEHNQAVSNWKALCSEINSAFDQNICTSHYETLKTLE